MSEKNEQTERHPLSGGSYAIVEGKRHQVEAPTKQQPGKSAVKAKPEAEADGAAKKKTQAVKE